MRVKGFFVILVLIMIGTNSLASSKNEKDILATIDKKDVLLYEKPTTLSPIVRRMFPGEVVKITEVISGSKGEKWGKVYLSPKQEAYIQGSYFENSGSVDIKSWEPEEVLRSQMPFSFSVKGTGELFGPGLQFRYLPFTRFGFTIGAGSVLDEGKGKGFSVAYGFTGMLSMGNFSPFVETGSSTLTISDGHSTLKISSFYINAGVEWIIRSGYYFGLGVSYNRSYSVQVSYDYGYADSKDGELKVDDYGSFGNLDGPESLQRLNPIALIGYSF
ncbi:MAG: hypothetical protein KDD25_06060 [Bdellovibrionales bacterium]|nr:hypothetical protein [Bdellovibrionales bacterium]